MKSQAITINQFSEETYVKWLESAEPSLPTTDSSFIFSQTQSPVTTPTYDQLVILFEQQQKAPNWASFLPPPNFSRSSNRCFDKSLIPGLTLETLDEILANYKKTTERVSIDSLTRQKLDVFFAELEHLLRLCFEIYIRTIRFQKG